MVRHPLVGELTLDWDTLAPTVDAEHQLVVWSAEPGSPSHDALRILASWAGATTPAPTDTGAARDRSMPS